uniref:Uncharacterized protein n=1 Tax=Opuntia streptacantha TaxID=393608 RepID=A0A7C9A729_OPUST
MGRYAVHNSINRQVTRVLSTLKLGSFKRAIRLNYLDSKDARCRKALSTIRNKLKQEIKRVAQGLGISYVTNPANYKYFCKDALLRLSDMPVILASNGNRKNDFVSLRMQEHFI